MLYDSICLTLEGQNEQLTQSALSKKMFILSSTTIFDVKSSILKSTLHANSSDLTFFNEFSCCSLRIETDRCDLCNVHEDFYCKITVHDNDDNDDDVHSNENVKNAVHKCVECFRVELPPNVVVKKC